MTSLEFITKLVRKYLDRVIIKKNDDYGIFVYAFSEQGSKYIGSVVMYSGSYLNISNASTRDLEVHNIDLLTVTQAQIREIFLSTFPRHFNVFCDSTRVVSSGAHE
jgi:hypothetical protein